MNRQGGPPAGRGFPNQRGGMTSGSNREGGIPNSIKCLVCHKMRPKGEFSNRQLLKFSSYNKGYTRNPESIKITCTNCTAGQTVELKCCVCDATKGLEDFAKTQRKDPDNARCKKCVDRDLETEPDMAPPDSGDESEENNDSEEDWDRKDSNSNSASSRKPPLRAPPRPTERWADSEYEESSASSQNFGPSVSSNNTAALRSQSGYPAPSSQYSDTRTNNADGDADEWETVQQPKKSYGNPWGGGQASSNRGNSAPRQAPATSKGGWAKVQKVPKSKENETRWGSKVEDYNEDQQNDYNEWDAYARNLRDQKAGKPPKKK